MSHHRNGGERRSSHLDGSGAASSRAGVMFSLVTDAHHTGPARLFDQPQGGIAMRDVGFDFDRLTGRHHRIPCLVQHPPRVCRRGFLIVTVSVYDMQQAKCAVVADCLVGCPKRSAYSGFRTVNANYDGAVTLVIRRDRLPRSYDSPTGRQTMTGTFEW